MKFRISLASIIIALPFAHAASAQGKSALNCDYHRLDSVILTHADVPLYPALAVQARVSGTVQVKILLKGGGIVSADVIPGANPVLAASAKENLQTWRFATQSYGEFCVTYTYALDGAELSEMRNPKIEMELPERVKITTSPVESHPVNGNGGDVE